MTNPSIPVLCTFESRRSEEMRSLIERLGGTAVVAPSMQEVCIGENRVAIGAIRQILSKEVDYLVLLTGVGTEAMLDVADSQQLKDELLEAMQQIPILVRGPKPAAVLSKLGLKYAVKAPEPNTWHELLTAIDAAELSFDGKLFAVQEYGIPNPEFYDSLTKNGAKVLPIPVYRWALPDDTQPLKDAIQQTIEGRFQALLFTSAQQVRHVLMIADELQCRNEFLAATQNTVIASIGPTCSETILEEGLTVDFEASPPKMGPMVRGVLDNISSQQNQRDA